MRLRRLFYMDLGRNQFSGQLPADMGEKFARLRHLHLDYNKFTGTIPTTFPQMGSDRLETLSLNNNQLVGSVPSDYELQDRLSKYFFRRRKQYVEHELTQTRHLLLVLFITLPVSYTLQGNSFTEPLDKDICRLSVFRGGENVEFNADCNICTCDDDHFCDRC